MRMAVNEMIGVNLNSASLQSEIAPAVLELVRWVLNDVSYVERIKRHYQLFKEAINAEYIRAQDEVAKTIPARATPRPRRHRHPRRTDTG